MKRFGDNVLSDKFLAIDIETTCLDENSATAGIIEVYAGIYSNGRLNQKIKSLYFHPNCTDTYDFHRISIYDLMGKDRFEESDNSKLKELLLECCDPKSSLTLMAYYAPFEYKWLSKFLNINLKNIRVCDPREIYKLIEPDVSHKLVDAAKELCGITPDIGWAFHRAEDDVKAMTNVYRALLSQISSDDLEDYIPNEYIYNVSEKIHD